MIFGTTSAPVCLVTGATAGIGTASALMLSEPGAHVCLAARDRDRGAKAADEITRLTGNPTKVVVVDLARPASIRTGAAEVLQLLPRLDVLVNNAGVWSADRRETPDGLELVWATNVLGYYLLTELLSKQLSESKPARVVMVASGLAHSLDLSDPEFKRRRYSGIKAYAQSKQSDRMLTRSFSRRLAPLGVTVNSMHPDFTRTAAFAKGGGLQGAIAGLGAMLFGRSPRKAADTAVWLALSPDVRDVTGRYFRERRDVVCEHTDEAAEEKLHAL